MKPIKTFEDYYLEQEESEINSIKAIFAAMNMLNDLTKAFNDLNKRMEELEKVYKALNDAGLGEDSEFTPEFVNQVCKKLNHLNNGNT